MPLTICTVRVPWNSAARGTARTRRRSTSSDVAPAGVQQRSWSSAFIGSPSPRPRGARRRPRRAPVASRRRRARGRCARRARTRRRARRRFRHARRRVSHAAQLSDEPLARRADHDRVSPRRQPLERREHAQRVLAALRESDPRIHHDAPLVDPLRRARRRRARAARRARRPSGRRRTPRARSVAMSCDVRRASASAPRRRPRRRTSAPSPDRAAGPTRRSRCARPRRAPRARRRSSPCRPRAARREARRASSRTTGSTSPHLLVGVDAVRALRPRRLPADVEDVRALGDHRLGARDGIVDAAQRARRR